MATSGTIQQAIMTGYRLQIAWTVDSQSVANNTSTVTAKVQLVSTGASYTIVSSASKSGSLTINGATYTFNFTASLSGNQTKTIYTKTVTVAHNADGTKTCAFSATAGINVTLSGTYYGNVTASGSGVFNTIARASTIASVTSSVAVNGTNAVTVNITRASSSFTHTVEFAFGNYTHAITGVATSASFAIPTSWLNAIPNATSGTAAVAVTTYSGTTKIGFSATGTFTLTVPASVVPTISTVSLSEAVSGLATQFGGYVQNKSKIAVNITAAGALSSTIKSYKTTIQGANFTASSFTSGILTQSGTSTVTITVTDSRGRTATTTRSITVAAYSSPKITAFTAIRANGLGSADDNGTLALARLVFNVSAVNNKNTKSYIVECKPKSSNTWTTVGSGSAYTYDNNMLLTANMSPDASYDLRFSLTDYFSTVTAQTEIATAFTLLDFNASGKGIAFGKVSELTEGVEYALPVHFLDTINVGNNRISPLVAITVHRNNVNQSIAAANVYEQIKFAGATTLGNGLSIDANGGVVIGDGVRMIRISGQVTVGAQVNGLKYAAIWTSASDTHLSRSQANITTAAPWTINFSPKLVSVSPGEVLTIRVYGQPGDVVYGGTMQTYFTVEAVG